jgi:glycosyltransferase involved in cell wall biosynthesis
MKLLIAVSSLDPRLPYSCTISWWDLFKALYEQGVDLQVAVYQGRTIPSPWWESHENPCYWEGYAFANLKKWLHKYSRINNASKENSVQDQATLKLIRAIIRPRWSRFLQNILNKNRDTDAVLFINIPPNHLRGIPTEIRKQYNLPVICYDPDLPASLPGFQGFATGFRIYQDADLNEYDLFLGNSIGGVEELKKMGAKIASPLIWGVDPVAFSPLTVANQDIDVFFYGSTSEYRRDWMEWMLTEPSKRMPERRFAVRSFGFMELDQGNIEFLKNVPFSKLREYCCRSKINLNIVRETHATVYGSASLRPFELASMACCMVSNPYSGLDEWFEPGKEIYIVSEPGEIPEIYQWLWSHEKQRLQIGKMARERVLKEHTHKQRAQQLIKSIQELL